MSTRGAGRQRGQPEVISRWEWVTGAAGLLLVLFALAVTLRDATQASSPPALTARVDSVGRQPSGFVAHVTVSNAGGMAAEAVVVGGELLGGAQPERSEVTLDHLPPHASRHVGLLFTRAPAAAQLDVRVLGYVVP